MSKKVAVIMGSDSDFPTVSAAVKKLKSFGVPVEVHVMSAHTEPPMMLPSFPSMQKKMVLV